MIMGPVMGRILELIHEWKNTLCVQSKHKEDLVHIRDMHRLLSYKGGCSSLGNANCRLPVQTL